MWTTNHFIFILNEILYDDDISGKQWLPAEAYNDLVARRLCLVYVFVIKH